MFLKPLLKIVDPFSTPTYTRRSNFRCLKFDKLRNGRTAMYFPLKLKLKHGQLFASPRVLDGLSSKEVKP